MIGLEYLLLVFSLLILTSIGIAKLFDNLGIPTILLFIGVGMLAGSEGLGGIQFNDARLAQSIGIIALVLILFSGGIDTNWQSVKSSVLPASLLATLGVLLTAILVGVFVMYLLEIPLLWGILVGAIISSTDAAAVFSILRGKNSRLKENVQPLLELESGSNDPMAVFLTIGTIELILNPAYGFINIVLLFIYQMGLGLIAGLLFGRAIVYLLNKLTFSYEGIYPVFALALIVMTFGITTVAGGSGFLAVYVAGLIVGNSSFIQKKGLIRFFDGLAWLGQIAMFITLGLLVFPSHLVEVLLTGLIISAFLMFIARPASVFISLAFSNYNWREKALVSWVGLRGAVPIILATFPMLAGVMHAEIIFNIVFFIVLTSALLQGWSLASVAKFFKLDLPLKIKKRYPIEFNPVEGTDTELIDFIVPFNSLIAGKSLVELDFPNDSRVVLIWRNETSIVPSGGTILEEGDTLLILVNKNNLERIKEIFSH